MAKLNMADVFKAQKPKPETAMDKTSRIVRKLVDDEAEQRQAKIERLRNTRLEREANTPAETVAAKPKTRASKIAPKR